MESRCTYVLLFSLLEIIFLYLSLKILNLSCHALLTPIGSLPLSEQRGRSGQGGVGRRSGVWNGSRGGRENCD